MESPDNFSPRDCILVGDALAFAQHVLPEEKKVARRIGIHRPSMLLHSRDALDRISQAKLLLTGKMWQGEFRQVLVEQGGRILIDEVRFVFNGKIGERGMELLRSCHLPHLLLS